MRCRRAAPADPMHGSSACRRRRRRCTDSSSRGCRRPRAGDRRRADVVDGAVDGAVAGDDAGGAAEGAAAALGRQSESPGRSAVVAFAPFASNSAFIVDAAFCAIRNQLSPATTVYFAAPGRVHPRLDDPAVVVAAVVDGGVVVVAGPAGRQTSSPGRMIVVSVASFSSSNPRPTRRCRGRSRTRCRRGRPRAPARPTSTSAEAPHARWRSPPRPMR